MKFQKKEKMGVPFARKGQDIKNGDLVIITNSGKEMEGQFGTQTIFNIKKGTVEMAMSFNQTSINAMIDEYGDDSELWIGKEVKIHSIKQNVAGKFLDVYYVAPIGYEMGEVGFEKTGDTPVSTDDGEIVPF